MKIKMFFVFGVLSLAVISYEFCARFYLWNTIMDETSMNREKYMALRDVFLKKYGNENIYHLKNSAGYMGISILLGFISIFFFILILISINKSYVKNNIYKLKKAMIIILLGGASIITFMNLWTLM